MTQNNHAPMTRAEFIAELRAEIDDFDQNMAEKYPLLGDPTVPEKNKPVDQKGTLSYGDWFEQFLAYRGEL